MSGSLSHLRALVHLADVEFQREEYADRSGIYRALLSQAMPYLRSALKDMRERIDRINDDRWAQGLPEVDEVHQ